MPIATKPARLRRRPFEHLLVPTDFSTGAAGALTRAASLPLAEGARITIVHVLPAGLPRKVGAPLEQAASRQLEQLAVALSKAASLGGADIEVGWQLGRGQAYVEIIRRARSAGADLIVVGRHGRRAVKDMFLGSTAERVIGVGDIPVLVAGGEALRAYRRALLAVDLEDTSRAVVELGLRVLGPEIRTATMVHAFHLPFEGFLASGTSPAEMSELAREYRKTASAGLARLQASLGEIGVRWRTSLVRGDPRAAILTEANRRRVDLIAVGTHGRKGLSHALVGSVAEWVLRAARCDVLVARPARVSFALP